MDDWNTLRRALMDLHQKLLQYVRADYVREEGRSDPVGPGELLMLATRDDRFAWLRSLSELMADIDHLSEGPQDDAVALRSAVRGAVERLLTPPGEGEPATAFAARYWHYVRGAPDVTMAHAAVRQALQSWPAPTAGASLSEWVEARPARRPATDVDPKSS